MSRLQQFLWSGRSLLSEIVDTFIHGGPRSPGLAVAGCPQHHLPLLGSSTLSPWGDWLTLAAPRKKPSKRTLKRKRANFVPIPLENVTQCLTCGGMKEKGVLCPTCLKDILVQSAAMKKEIEESWKAAPHNLLEKQRNMFAELKPKFGHSMIKYPVDWVPPRPHTDYDQLLGELHKNPLVDRLPEELYDKGSHLPRYL